HCQRHHSATPLPGVLLPVYGMRPLGCPAVDKQSPTSIVFSYSTPRGHPMSSNLIPEDVKGEMLAAVPVALRHSLTDQQLDSLLSASLELQLSEPEAGGLAGLSPLDSLPDPSVRYG